MKKLNNKKTPKINSLVKFNCNSIPKNYKKEYPFKPTDVFLFLGEVTQAPGHCCVINIKTGKFYGFFHTSDFIQLTSEEV
jgi:hypothetical protein